MLTRGCRWRIFSPCFPLPARRSASETLRVVTLDVQEQGPVSTAVFRRLALAVVDSALGEELGESLERLAHQPAAYRGLRTLAKRLDGDP